MAFKHQALYGDLNNGIFSPFIYKTNKQSTSICNYLSSWILSQSQEFKMRSKIPPSAVILPPSNFYTIFFITSLAYCLSESMRWDSLWICLQDVRHHDGKMCFFYFNIFFFFHNLRKQFSPKPWRIKVSTIVEHFYGMLIKNWQGENSWGQILKHLFSLKSHWIQCYFTEDFNTRSFTWIRTLAFRLLIILWLACI